MKHAVTIILGHPAGDSFCHALGQRYAQGARDAGAEVRICDLCRLEFDPVLHNAYRTIQTLEPGLLACQEDIRWADHVGVVFPVWWGAPPALLKGFIDRTFHPGFAFKFEPGKLLQTKLLEGRSARIICTVDSPPLYHRWIVGAPGVTMMKKSVLEFCGFRPVRSTLIGSIKLSTPQRRARWLDQVEGLGRAAGADT